MSDHEPIPKVRLRDMVSGRVASAARGDVDGEFVFDEVGAVTCLVELVDLGDRVQAVGEVLTAIAGETVTTFIVLSNTALRVAAILGIAAAVSTATTTAVLAVVSGSVVSGES